MKAKKALLFDLAGLVLLTWLAGRFWPNKRTITDGRLETGFRSFRRQVQVIVSNDLPGPQRGLMPGSPSGTSSGSAPTARCIFDYKPFSMLGGEVEVLNQLQMGAIQGMGVSSVASTNLGPRFGVVNLPFLIDSFEKLDKFVASGSCSTIS